MLIDGSMTALSVVLGWAAGEAHMFVLRRRERILHEAEWLRRAGQYLDEHIEAFDRFVDDAASPQDLKDTLVDFGDAISRHDTALQCAQALASDKPVALSEDAVSMIKSLDLLRAHRPDLVQAFNVTVASGLFYMLLRWPETAQCFAEAASRIATDPSRGVGFAAKTRLRFKETAATASGFGPAPAMAGA